MPETNAAHAALAIRTPLTLAEARRGPAKVRLLMAMFGLSLRDVCDGASRSISRSQLHRILRGQPPTACERRAIAMGVNECLKARCDSAYLFGD